MFLYIWLSNYNNDFASFNTVKSSIISSALGKALGLTTSSTIADIATKIDAVTNNDTVSGSITTSGGSYIIPAGYHNGSGKVTGPTLAALVGTNATLDGAAKLLTGYTAYGKNGTKYTGSMVNNGAVSKTFTPSTSSQSYIIPAGYHNGSGKVICNAISSLSFTNILSSNGTGVWGANGSVASLSYKATEACYVVVALESYQHNNGGAFAHTVSGGTTIKDSGNIGTYSGNLRVMLIELAKDATLTMKVESAANTYSYRSVAYIAFKI